MTLLLGLKGSTSFRLYFSTSIIFLFIHLVSLLSGLALYCNTNKDCCRIAVRGLTNVRIIAVH